MKQSEPEAERPAKAGLRLELVIAVCALFISTLATAASWWQTQATWQQTQIIDQQLSAQVWPYVGFGENFVRGDTVEFTIANDGLGPAIVRSLTLEADGKRRSSFVDLLHAVLGPDLMKHSPHGESMGLTEDGSNPGFVLRPGDSQSMFSLRSKTYAKKLIAAYQRVTIHACYCAIVPGHCWQTNTAGSSNPQPVAECREDPGDLLHVTTVNELFHPF